MVYQKRSSDPPQAVVRAWAKEQGLIPMDSDTGRLGQDLIESYRTAMMQEAAPKTPPSPTPPTGSGMTLNVASGSVTVYVVKSPTGTEVRLPTQAEADWYVTQRDQYTKQNKFINVSDLQDLARLLTLEVMIHRWSTWLTQGFEYDGGNIQPHVLKSNIHEYSREIRAVKASLGIDRVTRDKDKGETVGDYINTLLIRAKEFGVQRNKEYETAVTFLWELISKVQTYDRCDEIERRDLNLNPETILEWVRKAVVPEWNQITTSFQDQQKMWISEL